MLLQKGELCIMDSTKGIQNVIDFVERVKKSDSLKQQCMASDFDTVRGLAKDAGFDFTKDDFQAYLVSKGMMASLEELLCSFPKKSCKIAPQKQRRIPVAFHGIRAVILGDRCGIAPTSLARMLAIN
jgi:predicted ribosomally synthesized peptide with nif11-like leader